MKWVTKERVSSDQLLLPLRGEAAAKVPAFSFFLVRLTYKFGRFIRVRVGERLGLV